MNNFGNYTAWHLAFVREGGLIAQMPIHYRHLPATHSRNMRDHFGVWLEVDRQSIYKDIKCT